MKGLFMNILKLTIILVIGLTVSGCVSELNNQEFAMSQVYKAVYTDKPVKIDGKLDDQIWQTAPSYPLYLSKDKADAGETLKEGGCVKFAWDEQYFYLAADLKDSDIIAQGDKDQMHHYRYGDVCELFLKPAEQPYYWELYVTPAGKKTSFFFPSKAALKNPEIFENYSCGLKVAAKINGTLNSSQDTDIGWTAEMAVPIKDLEAKGYKFGPSQKWTVLVGRYNYFGGLDTKELSMTPQLSKTSYHLTEEFAKLQLIK